KKIPLKIAYLVMIWFVVHVLAITIDGLSDKKQRVDAGVVLGNKVEKDGRPSDRLRYRLEKAVELYEGGYLPYIIVSGAEGFDEAEVMKQYLVQKGIPSDKILTDSMGFNTRMTAENTRKIADDMGFQSVMVITQFYHISRTKLAFSKAGFADVYSAHANYFELRDFYSLFREFFAYYKYLIFE
ncbi:YdcF family protein, partial [Brevibacillus massiliensis]|uniref:YdcF family protein n=1 Tax=Brevibacillus massiliensis TaxID=1118054 RepID=UPI00037DCC7A